MSTPLKIKYAQWWIHGFVKGTSYKHIQISGKQWGRFVRGCAPPTTTRGEAGERLPVPPVTLATLLLGMEKPFFCKHSDVAHLANMMQLSKVCFVYKSWNAWSCVCKCKYCRPHTIQQTVLAIFICMKRMANLKRNPFLPHNHDKWFMLIPTYLSN